MLLAVDIGNSNIVLGGIKGDEITFITRLYTERKMSNAQYALQIKGILEINNVKLDEIEGCIISSVVPPVLDTVKQAITIVIKHEPMVVGPGIKTGLNILTDNPAQLGSDLVVNAVACVNRFTPPIITIDMGTATTVAVIDKNKSYIGGAIFPGVRISLDALSEKTAQLPSISLDEPVKVIGANTIDCMQSGVVFGNASMIDGIVERMEEELGEPATIVATGGISRHIVPFCKRDIVYDDNLILKGLKILYDKNKKD